MTLKLIAIFIVTMCVAKNHDQSSRFKSVYCVNNSTERHTIHLCKIKVTRNSSFLLFNVTIKTPINKPLYLKVTVFYKYGLIYRQIIPVPEIEVCSMMKNVDKTHPLIKATFDVFGDSIKPFLDGCPYSGRYNLSFSLNMREFPSEIPSGMYKVATQLRTPDKKSIVVIAQFEVTSSIKTSF